MNKQEARREAHRITADLINQYLERSGDDDPADWPRIEAALRDLEDQHIRRSVPR